MTTSFQQRLPFYHPQQLQYYHNLFASNAEEEKESQIWTVSKKILLYGTCALAIGYLTTVIVSRLWFRHKYSKKKGAVNLRQRQNSVNKDLLANVGKPFKFKSIGSRSDTRPSSHLAKTCHVRGYCECFDDIRQQLQSKYKCRIWWIDCKSLKEYQPSSDGGFNIVSSDKFAILINGSRCLFYPVLTYQDVEQITSKDENGEKTFYLAILSAMDLFYHYI